MASILSYYVYICTHSVLSRMKERGAIGKLRKVPTTTINELIRRPSKIASLNDIVSAKRETARALCLTKIHGSKTSQTHYGTDPEAYAPSVEVLRSILNGGVKVLEDETHTFREVILVLGHQTGFKYDEKTALYPKQSKMEQTQRY